MSDRENLKRLLENMPEEKFQAVKAFAHAINTDDLYYYEPENVGLRDDPEFQEFVKQNKWQDRRNKGWKRRQDVFEFIEVTYKDFLDKKGLGRSSWIGLDNELLKRINQKSYDNRQAGLYLPSGIPKHLNLVLKQTEKTETPEELMMLEMKKIYNIVNNVKVRQFRSKSAKNSF